jgi:hypothetical protein
MAELLYVELNICENYLDYLLDGMALIDRAPLG